MSGSDQNMVDEEVHGTGEQRRHRGKGRNMLFLCMHTLQLKIDFFQGMDYEFIPSLTNANSEDIEKYFSQAQYKLRNMVKQCLLNCLVNIFIWFVEVIQTQLTITQLLCFVRCSR